VLRLHVSAALLTVALALVAAGGARAQGAPPHARGDDQDDEHLHFSHPLVAESPSPDTKLRLDYVWTRTGPPADRTTERGERGEGEYAFTPGLSLAVTLPYTSRRTTGLPDARGIGNTEVSLKAASLKWGERGVLVGGGLSVGLPTGSDARGIGTSHAVELEPFADVGLERGGLQIVGIGHYGTTVRNPAGVDAEHQLAFNGSALYRVSPIAETLLEVEAARTVAGAAHTAESSVAPGLKVYPFPNRHVMFGVSAILGLTGEARDARGVVVSAFYHF